MIEKYIVIPTNRFKKSFDKLSIIEQKQIEEKVELLEKNPYYPSLKTKKMKGKYRNYESRVNDNIRIIWKFKNNEIILTLDIGHHDILRKY
jgi:mRNA-degrading endonuclease YafQ of YafQ-DinJ toxin-antitoxin module